MFVHKCYITEEYDTCCPLVHTILPTTININLDTTLGKKTYGYVSVREDVHVTNGYINFSTYVCILFKDEKEAMLAKIQYPGLKKPSESLLQYLTEVGII